MRVVGIPLSSILCMATGFAFACVVIDIVIDSVYICVALEISMALFWVYLIRDAKFGEI